MDFFVGFALLPVYIKCHLKHFSVAAIDALLQSVPNSHIYVKLTEQYMTKMLIFGNIAK